MNLAKKIILTLASATVISGCGVAREYQRADLRLYHKGDFIYAYDRNKDGKWDKIWIDVSVVGPKKSFSQGVGAEDSNFNGSWDTLQQERSSRAEPGRAPLRSSITLYDANDDGIYEVGKVETNEISLHLFDWDHDGKFDLCMLEKGSAGSGASSISPNSNMHNLATDLKAIVENSLKVAKNYEREGFISHKKN